MRAECSIKDCTNRQVVRTWCDNHYRKWVRAGTPHRAATAEERFIQNLDRATSDCWLWRGHITRWGYGAWQNGGSRRVHTHRWSYEHFVGQIPAGLELDHICHTMDLSCRGGPTCQHRRCCNPAHLEPVTHAENMRRGRPKPLKTHCKRGHEFSVANTYVTTARQGWTVRQCRTCKRDKQRISRCSKNRTRSRRP
jgi:hypothetical protein